MYLKDGQTFPVTGSGSVEFAPAKNYASITGDLSIGYVVRMISNRENSGSLGVTEVKFDLSFTPDKAVEGLFYHCTWEVDGRIVASRTGAFIALERKQQNWVAGGFFLKASERDGRFKAYLFHNGKSLPGVSKSDHVLVPFRAALDKLDMIAAKSWLENAGGNIVLPIWMIEQVARGGDPELLSLSLDRMSRKGFVRSKADGILRAAAETGRVQCAQLLIDRKVDPNIEGQLGENALHLAVRNGDLDMIRLMLVGGGDPNKKMKPFGYPPLMVAMREDSPAAARLLLDNGAKWLNRSDVKDIRYLAAKNNWKRTMDLVLQHGVSPDASRGETPPILLAAKHGDGAVMELLIKAGADLDVKNNLGLTPVMVAANNGAKRPLELLRDAGVSLSVADKSYHTAADWAVLGSHSELAVELLEQAPLTGAAASLVLHHALIHKDGLVLTAILKQGAVLNPKLDNFDLTLERVVEEGRLNILEQAWAEGMPTNPTIYGSWNLAGAAKRYRDLKIIEAIKNRLGHEPVIAIPARKKLPIQVTKRAASFTPEEVGEDVESGEAKVDVYIDPEGVVRFPVVRSADPVTMGPTAQGYIRSWHFNRLKKDTSSWRRVIIPLTYSAEAFARENILTDWELDTRAIRVGATGPRVFWSGDTNITSAAWIRFTISKSGAVLMPRVLDSSDPKINQEALDHVRKWKYLPARKSDAEVWSEQTGILLFPSGEFLPVDTLISSRISGAEDDFAPKLTSWLDFILGRPELGGNKGRGFSLISFVVDKRGFATEVNVLLSTDEKLADEAKKVCNALEFEPVEIDGKLHTVPAIWTVVAGSDNDRDELARLLRRSN